jgi:hypothetical protein
MCCCSRRPYLATDWSSPNWPACRLFRTVKSGSCGTRSIPASRATPNYSHPGNISAMTCRSWARYYRGYSERMSAMAQIRSRLGQLLLELRGILREVCRCSPVSSRHEAAANRRSSRATGSCYPSPRRRDLSSRESRRHWILAAGS